jgi:ABC-type nitrate/sulfonate/bicarbonate transport system ATPase subunit
LDVNAGESVCIIGRSGAGKSTLAYSRQRRPSLADVTVKARNPSAGVACADVAAVAELALSELRP